MEGPGVGDRELVTRTVSIEQKIFYLDLKENSRGRYLKISEKSSLSRSTIVVPLAGVVWFVDLFNYYANGDGGELSSKELQLATKVRRYPLHASVFCILLYYMRIMIACGGMS